MEPAEDSIGARSPRSRCVAPARLGDPPRARFRRLPEDRPIDLNALVAPYVGAVVVGLVVGGRLILLAIVAVQARRQSADCGAGSTG